MASKGWFNLETAGSGIPETQFFEGDSAFSFLGLTRTQRLYGFIGSCVCFRFVFPRLPFPPPPEVVSGCTATPNMHVGSNEPWEGMVPRGGDGNVSVVMLIMLLV